MILHKAPLGLLELFRLRTLGRNPSEFSDAIQGVADVTDFYGADLLQTVTETAGAGAITSGMSSTSSQFARRYVAISGQIQMGAAAGNYVHLRVQATFGASTVCLASQHCAPLSAGQVFTVSAPVSRGIVLPPGHTLTLNISGDAGGADHVPAIRYGFMVLDGR